MDTRSSRARATTILINDKGATAHAVPSVAVSLQLREQGDLRWRTESQMPHHAMRRPGEPRHFGHRRVRGQTRAGLEPTPFMIHLEVAPSPSSEGNLLPLRAAHTRTPYCAVTVVASFAAALIAFSAATRSRNEASTLLVL